MNDLLNAINPWHLIFDLIGWCFVAAIFITCLFSALCFIGDMVAGFVRKLRGK